ncbi:hypothetical protein ACEPAI_917 [Sanghuangporus weigelae]
MANAELIFNDCTLDLIIPNGSLSLPAQESSASTADEWLKQARVVGERQQAFFDEKLDFFLAIRFKQDASAGLLSPDVFAPPPLLLSFLNHLQVSLEATYIPPEQLANTRLSSPPVRSSSSLQTPRGSGLGIPLPLFPPQTPSPKPSTNETDRKYAYAEGTPLKSFIWGEDLSEDVNSFRFLWSSSEKCWIAIYRIFLPVVYIRTEFEDPLLCLTTSITLRDKPISPSPQRHTLFKLIEEVGPLPPLTDAVPAKEKDIPTVIEPGSPKRVERGFLEEVNILEGLSCDSLFQQEDEDDLYLPTTRLGASARRAYSLPPLSPASPTDPKPKPSHSLPVLRKSFRKTLGLASGFHVRMRTVLVPQLYLPQETEEEHEAGRDESTVVLSIEIENPGDSDAAFSVDAVEVYMKNESTKIRLIGWGEEGFTDPMKVFPLIIRPVEQYYLLYAVMFLRSPEFELSQSGEQDEFKKMVSFNIIGRPCMVPGLENSLDAKDRITYLTLPFLSRWNCRLDLDPRRRESIPPPDTISDGGANAVPVPPSPFPIASPHSQQAQEHAASQATVQANTVAGPKRHTFAGVAMSPHLLTPQRPMSLTTSPLGTPGTSRISSPLGKLGMKPWTVGTLISTPGHLSPPLPPLPNGSVIQKNLGPPSAATASNYPFPALPQTPAFPSYGNQPMTPRPNSVTPSFGQMGTVGMGMDARREKLGGIPGMPMTPAPPMTPRPQLSVDERALPASFRSTGNLAYGAKDFIVSVSLLLPSPSNEGSSASSNHPRQRLIHPLDEFFLEIFVFNQSPYVRTLEATLADRQRRRDDQKRHSSMISSPDVDTWKLAPAAFMALESKVRIGPLGPSTCQSVTMRFLAMLPGVHTIDGLILTDLDTWESISLRSVMDFAVLSRDAES